MRSGARPMRQSGVSSVVAASVAPEVNTTCSGAPLTSAATARREASTMRRAARPSAWTEEALAAMSKAASIASRAAGSSGALAL